MFSMNCHNSALQPALEYFNQRKEHEINLSVNSAAVQTDFSLHDTLRKKTFKELDHRCAIFNPATHPLYFALTYPLT